MVGLPLFIAIFLHTLCLCEGFVIRDWEQSRRTIHLFVLSNDFFENDLVAIRLSPSDSGRLCAVKPDLSVSPLCQREDDVETDLFGDPREFDNKKWQDVTDEQVTGTYGEGWYGQRPVPSLGGGPGERCTVTGTKLLPECYFC